MPPCQAIKLLKAQQGVIATICPFFFFFFSFFFKRSPQFPTFGLTHSHTHTLGPTSSSGATSRQQLPCLASGALIHSHLGPFSLALSKFLSVSLAHSLICVGTFVLNLRQQTVSICLQRFSPRLQAHWNHLELSLLEEQKSLEKNATVT